MVMNIIMASCLYPVMLIIWIIFKILGKDTKRYVFGVTLTKEQKNSEEVKQIIREYNRDHWIILIALMWEPLIAFAFDKVSIQFTIWMIWFLALVVIYMLPYAKANKKTMQFKGETPEEESVISYIELRSVKTIKIHELMYPVLLGLIGPIYLLIATKTMALEEYQRTNYWFNGITYLIVAILTIAFTLIAIWMDRRRTLVINGDSVINQNYSRAMKMLWKKFWLTIAYINALVALVPSIAAVFDFHSLLIFILMSIVETLVLIILLVKLFLEKRTIEDAYESKFEIPAATDDDRNWIWGMFYYNKHDKNALVEKRFGIGTTMNMATTAGKITEIIGLLALVWIPFFCVYMIMEDYTPTHLLYQNNQVICRHLKEEYVIDQDDIVEVIVVNELPKDRHKNVGTSTEYIEKGRFSSREEGSFKEFAVFSHDVFLKITTKDTTYYVNGNSAEETYAVYEQIK